jgi:Mg-chelatase subunit ChlI
MKDVPVGCVRFATIVALGLLAGAMPGYLRSAAAETAREACTHDAFRLCSNAIPDVARTKACLARHRNSLSPKCQAAFSGRSTHERSPDRKAQEERSPDRKAQEERSPDRSAQEERSPDRSAQEERSPDRSGHERHYSTHARHYGYYRHYHHYRRFHFFPFF